MSRHSNVHQCGPLDNNYWILAAKRLLNSHNSNKLQSIQRVKWQLFGTILLIGGWWRNADARIQWITCVAGKRVITQWLNVVWHQYAQNSILHAHEYSNISVVSCHITEWQNCTKFIFGHPPNIERIIGKFTYEGHQDMFKVKVTGAK